jgi:hypothetical protein
MAAIFLNSKKIQKKTPQIQKGNGEASRNPFKNSLQQLWAIFSRTNMCMNGSPFLEFKKKSKKKTTNPERKWRSIKRGLTSKAETTPKSEKKEKEPAQIEIPKPRS